MGSACRPAVSRFPHTRCASAFRRKSTTANGASRPPRRSPHSCRNSDSRSRSKRAPASARLHDDAYRAAGVTVVTDTRALWSSSDIILKVRAPERHPALGVNEVDLLREGQVLIAFLWPAQNPDLLKRLAAKGVTALAMDSVPRISRAQKMDALSSMANIARLSRGHRGGAALRPILHRTDHGRRPDSAGEGARDRRRRRRTRPRSAPRAASARSSARSTRGRK